ncbi:MAG TPA: VWA domain-containing protein [Bryobacteraceae bacterium]|jgi:VWFA-related protein|nr:VWA domain-containing protein [Bryobacteraceae bacterium]
MRLLVGNLLAACGLTVALWAQGNAPQQPAPMPFTYPGPALPPIDPNDYKLTSNVEVVLLDASVKGPDGGFVSDLKKDDFKVLEDGAPQTISIFNSGDIPVTLGLVVDNSASMRAKRPDVVVAALTFVQQSNPKDELFVLNFNDRIRMGLPKGMDFTDTKGPLREALLGNPVTGRTSLYDGLKVALQHLEKGRQSKKTLILVSDGGDNMSQTTEDEIFNMARLSKATIYTIGIYDDNDKDKNPGFLKKLAAITGGESFLPSDHEGKLVNVCEKIAKDIRTRYTVGYVPENRVLDGKVRKVRLLATSPEGKKLKVRTRSEYLAGDTKLLSKGH